jgi:hypothetical protein
MKKAQDQYVIVEWWRNPREKKLDAHFEQDEGENKLSLRSLSSTRKKKRNFSFYPFFPLLVDEAIRFPNATFSLPVDERRLL